MSGRARPRDQFHLTERELETVALAADGLTLHSIARRLTVTYGAVQSRLKFARLKSGVPRTTALVHSVYASKQLPLPATEQPVPLSADQMQVLGYLSEGLTAADMRARVSWPEYRLRDAYADLLAALDATDRPAYAIKRAWAMGHLGQEQQPT
ncbi:hypothetical protein [Streptomyces sp. A1547]|uniref:hypothetical protein n=1 Tax=Streptomyces sp. A1547 TaxID=2563105 RepID=UPI00109EB6D3|nr:hypothetical protein [Streptomyces sp. A1547]THA38131.1 hypothetical protein E6W17_16740 [Streptomyces sp. A1547]